MLLNVWSAMVGPSVSVWLMIVLCRFESGRHRAFSNAAHALPDILRGLADTVRRQTFCFSLPGRLGVNFTDGVPGRVETLRCGGLSTSLHCGAGAANQVILDVGTG